MIRRSPHRLVIVAASVALVAPGCATISDADVAARVGDSELSDDALSAMLREQSTDPAAPDDGPDRVPMDLARQILNNFVLDRILRDDLAAAGVALDEPTTELSASTLEESVNLAIATWQEVVPPRTDPEELRPQYDLGLAASGIACTAHILVDSVEVADEVLARLDAGDEFSELAAEYSTDQGSANQGGMLPCDSTANFQSQYIVEYVNAAASAPVGVAVGPVQSQFGFHIILVRPFDDLTAAELAPLLVDPESAAEAFRQATTTADVHINPRYGTFDPAAGVIPLG